MTNLTSIILTRSPEVEKLLRDSPNLKPGDKLEAKVLEVRKDGKVSLDFGKFQADVELKIPVKEGDVVHLVVVEKGKQLRLKVESVEPGKTPESKQTPPDSQAQQSIKSADPLQDRLGEVLRSMMDIENPDLYNPEASSTSQKQGRRVSDLQEEISRELIKVKEQLESTPTKEAAPGDEKNRAETLLKNAANTIRKLQDTGAPDLPLKLENLASTIRDLHSALDSNMDFQKIRDNIVNQIAEIDKTIEKLNIPEKNELREIVDKLNEAAEKIGKLNSPKQLQELREIVSDEILPNLDQLKAGLDNRAELLLKGSERYKAITELSQRIETFRSEIRQNLQPPITTPDSPESTATDLPQVFKAVEKALDLILDIPVFNRSHIPTDSPGTARSPEPLHNPSRMDAVPTPPQIFDNETSPRTAAEMIEPKTKPTQEPGQDSEQARRTQEDIRQVKELLGSPQALELPPQIKKEINDLLERTELVIRKMPREIPSPEAAEKMEALSKALRDLRQQLETETQFREVKEDIAKQVENLQKAVEKLDLPNKKEIDAIMEKIARTLEKIEKLDSRHQAPEFQKIVKEELNPLLDRLSQAIEHRAENTAPQSPQNTALKEVAQHVETVRTQIDDALRRLPPPPRPEPEPGTGKEIASGRMAIEMEKNLDTFSIALKDLEESPELARFQRLIQNTEAQTNERTDRTDRNARSDQPPPPDTTPREPVKNSIETTQQNIKEVKELLSSPQAREIPPPTRRDLQNLMEQTEIVLHRIPAETTSPSSHLSENLEALSKAVRELRINTEAQTRFTEIKENIARQTQELKAAVEKLDLPDNKTIEKALKELDEAAQKIAKLETLKDLPQLRQIIEREIDPNLSLLREQLRSEIAKLTPDSPSQEKIRQTLQHVEKLQQNIQTEIKELPETSNKDWNQLMREIRNTALKILQGPETPTPPPEPTNPNENVQVIYENIKTALRLLQTKLQVSAGQLDLPKEIHTIFQDIQTDLHTAETSNNLLNQTNTLKNLIEKSGLAPGKMIQEITRNLTDMLNHITQLKNSQRFQELNAFTQNELKPYLKLLSDIFADPFITSQDKELHKTPGIAKAIQNLRETIEKSALQESNRTASQAPDDLAQTLDLLPQKAAPTNSTTPALQSLKNAENIAQLTQNIENLLSKLPQPSTGPDSSPSLPSKIHDLLSLLKSHIEPLDIGENALKLVPRLKSLIEDSGIFFEKKIADTLQKLTETSSRLSDPLEPHQMPEIKSIIEKDLKPNLLQLKEFLDNEKAMSRLTDQKTIETIRSAVDELLTNINNQQNRAVQNESNQNPVQVFSFTVPIKGEESAELKVFYNKKRKKDSPDEYKISLLLDMNKIGQVRSDFFYLKKNLTLTFFVRDQYIKDFFTEHLPDIRENLDPLFNKMNIDVEVSKEKIEAFTREENELEIITEKAVNVRI